MNRSLVRVSLAAVLVIGTGCGTRTTKSARAHGTHSARRLANAGAYVVDAMPNPCRGVALPIDQSYVPDGMCASLVASGVGGLRQITFAPNGDLFGQSTSGSIRRFRDVDGDGKFSPDAPETIVWANSGGNGNNVHIDTAAGYLYAGSPDGVKRWKYAATTDAGGAGDDVVINQPNDGGHGFHTVHVYDGWLYTQVGTKGNAANDMSPAYDTTRSAIKRFDLSKYAPGAPLDWADGEVFTVGLRNSVGFTRNAAGRMYAVVNGLDNVSYEGEDVHEDNPGEQIALLEKGRQYGAPFCFTAQNVATATGGFVEAGTQLRHEGFSHPHDDAWCAANSSKPAAFIQAHSAPLDITFFDGPDGALPARYKGGAFVALHGSWNRSVATGYKVIWVPFNADGTATMPTTTATGTTFPYETVFGGGSSDGDVDGRWSWSDATVPFSDSPRPAGVAVSPVDGALYISSDSGGAIYRVGLSP